MTRAADPTTFIQEEKTSQAVPSQQGTSRAQATQLGSSSRAETTPTGKLKWINCCSPWVPRHSWEGVQQEVTHSFTSTIPKAKQSLAKSTGQQWSSGNPTCFSREGLEKGCQGPRELCQGLLPHSREAPAHAAHKTHTTWQEVKA